MDIKKAENALEQVARYHGKEVSEIKREIEAAVVEAMRSEDPDVRGYWECLIVDGRVPTAEELIVQLGIVFLLMK